MKKLLLSLILFLSISPCFAQGNPTCPTRPPGDNTNACASTAFVQQNGGSGLIVGTSPISNGTNGQYLYDNAGILGEKVIPAADLPPGVATNTLNARTANYSLATTDCGKTITLGGSAFYTLTVGAASGFNISCVVVIANIDTGRGKVMSINGVSFPEGGILWPGQSFFLKNENNVWVPMGVPAKWKVLSGITITVDTSAGNDANDGLASGSGNAMATLAAATSRICTHFDVNALITIQTVTGQTHPGQTLCNYSGNIQASVTNPTIVGDTSSCANAANFTIDGVSASALGPVGVITPWTVKGMKLTSSVSGNVVNADARSILYLGQNVTFPASTGFHANAQYLSFLEFIGDYCITGGAVVHAAAQNQGQILIQPGHTITITGTPAFSSFFAQAITNGLMTWNSTTFSGSATGVRYSCSTGGGINTGGGGATFLPGNSVVSCTTPGWYQ